MYVPLSATDNCVSYLYSASHHRVKKYTFDIRKGLLTLACLPRSESNGWYLRNDPLLHPLRGAWAGLMCTLPAVKGLVYFLPGKPQSSPHPPTLPASPVAGYEPRHPGCFSLVRSIPFLTTSPVGPRPYSRCTTRAEQAPVGPSSVGGGGLVQE